MRINGTLQTEENMVIGKPEARKDMLACLFYLKRAASSGPAEARVLYREARS